MYKYTKAEHANSFIEKGTFRVGTLHDYTKQEKYSADHGILDTEEGRMTLFTEVEDETWNSINDVPDFVKGAISIDPGMEDLHISDCTFEMEYVSENLFVFCLSVYENQALLKEFENADACYEITSPLRFFTDAIEAMRPFGTFLGLVECRYVGRRHKHDTPNVHPLSVKPLDKAHQGEVRLVWQPYEPITTSGVIVSSRNLIGRARRIW